jgi:hypothetical protein
MIATLSSALLLSGCSNPSKLSYKNEQLQLQVKDAHLQLHGTQLKQQRENFSTLFLTQDLLRLDDGSIVMYENAQTDMQYQFDPTTTRSIGIIFDARSVNKVYENSLLFAYQVVLKDNRVLNMIVSQGYDQELIMVYGMSTSKLNSMLRELDPNAPSAYYKHSINLNNEKNPLMSRWTTYKIHIVPLVVPLRRIGRL